MVKDPPDILITTPESLYLMLTSAAREILRDVDTLILDEVHAVAGTKRGAHMALTVERLEALNETPFQRIGLSATQRPMDEIGRFVSGARPIRLVDAGTRKEMDLQVIVPLDDMREPGQGADVQDILGTGSEPSQPSIWPSIYPKILELVREHRSTIVFVNNRRLAERLALRLNDLANADKDDGDPHEEIARSHHGSLAREQRLIVEEELKAGRIPCLVATSSLELGIDMGAVDLVIQVESPKSVARGLQRIGRAGHELGAVSRGRIFPKFRADLLESAVVARRVLDGEIEETVIPRNPLDVLAQQIVAITADEEIAVDDLHRLVRRAYPFAELSRAQLENVLDMLAGRYPSDEFAELRPRIVWDRTAGVIRGRTGARKLAVTNAGTIPDRGLFGVHLVNGGGRVGELDEEMVYEARAGQTFLLGASTWRIEEITRDRVLVSPAPGVPGPRAVLEGRGRRPPLRARRRDREVLARARRAPRGEGAREAARRAHARREGRAQPAHVPERAGRCDRRRPVRPHRRDRALPRRDRRLARLPADAVRRTRARAVGARARCSPARVARHRGALDLVGRRDRAAPARRRRGAVDRGSDDRPRGDRGARGRRAVRLGALRRALSRERVARTADPAPSSRTAHAALAAAPEGAVAPAGRAEVRLVPDHPGDVPRVSAGRVRPAGAARDPARPQAARARPRRRRVAVGVAVLVVAALRLHRHLHVRGRHAARRASRAGAVARPRSAARAARAGGAARADRPRRARGGRGAAPRQRAQPRRAARRPAPARRPARG